MKKNPYEEFVTHCTKRYGDKKLVELLVVEGVNASVADLEKSGIDMIRRYELLELNKEHPDTLLKSPIRST
ncbi:hypothetical protein KXD40_009416 [Peronospora effusa]|nr:hypothetical protein KXD40_009416 [Peronospora effusa]